MIKIKKVEDRGEWENFINKQEYTLFVQSSKYGDFYKSLGEESTIIGVYDDDVLIGGSLVLSTHAKRGNFLYLPYGPVFTKLELGGLKAFSDFLRNYAKSEGYDFIKSSPFVLDNEENRKNFNEAGFKRSPMHVLAENTWILDLEGSEEGLLSGMKKNHRNLIRRCERENVRVEMSVDDSALKDFNKLHDETAKRHGFCRYSPDYIKKEFKAFSASNQALVFRAYLPDGRLDSVAIILFFGKMAAYRHAASLMLDKKVPSSYALQWSAIKEAKKQGMSHYNFWGVSPENAKKSHPFYGITHFKKGFGGHQLDLLPCHDMPIKSRYYINWIIETMRRFKRGF